MENLILLFRDVDFTNMIWQIITPLIFSIADVLTGFIQAIINRNVDSQKMRNGLWHKALLLIIIVLGFVTGFAFNVMFISRSICIFIIVMETVSIAENLKKAGIDLGRLGNLLKVKSENTIENVNYKKTVDILSKIVEENKSERSKDDE